MREESVKAGRGMRLRALALGLLLIAGFGVVAARAAKVQLFDVSRLSRLARDQTRREIEWAPRRGQINDRSGQPLAVTQEVDSIFADPGAFVSDAQRAAAADALAAALKQPRERLLRKLAGDKHFVWLQRRVDDATAERVRELGLDGIELVKEPKRFYPQRELAGHVLGFVGDEAGQEGLERELEPFLKGKPLSVPAVRDARGMTVLAQGAPDPLQLTGATVTTTLDVAIQHATERALGAAVAEYHAAGGWAVVMDVQSGAVLALAGSPSFDANKPGRDPAIWRNRAVQDQLEPGSTIKSFLMAIALEQKAIKQHELFWCEQGAWHTLGKTLHDTHPVGWADPTLILTQSSNICAAKIGLRLGPEKLIDGLKAFGFGERTAVGFPGEGRGQLRDPLHMPQISVATTAFGQGMSATGLQTVAAMAAIANGGVLLKPYLVERVVSADGTVLLERGREEVRRVLRPETARAVGAMLEENTRKGGSGTKAVIADFRVAGKTGTAQKVDPIRGGYNDKRLGSFLGFAPVESPRLAILVAIDEPQGKVYGAEVAAPAWGVIATEALRQLGVTPQSRREETVLREDRKKARLAKEGRAAAKAPAAKAPLGPIAEASP
jgi:cell division protein FtsI (penicillin-binding protein 3)